MRTEFVIVGGGKRGGMEGFVKEFGVERRGLLLAALQGFENPYKSCPFDRIERTTSSSQCWRTHGLSPFVERPVDRSRVL